MYRIHLTEQQQQELALLDQIRFAGLEDDLGHVEHGLVRGQLANLRPQRQADPQRAADDERSPEEQPPPADGSVD